MLFLRCFLLFFGEISGGKRAGVPAGRMACFGFFVFRNATPRRELLSIDIYKQCITIWIFNINKELFTYVQG